MTNDPVLNAFIIEMAIVFTIALLVSSAITYWLYLYVEQIKFKKNLQREEMERRERIMYPELFKDS